ncbi:MAG: MarR family winged helix-turn-helix transcriptional regulator [Lachnospirales bacterium]
MDKYEALKLDNQLCFSLYALSREIIKLYPEFLRKYNLTYTQYITMLGMWELEKTSFKNLGKKLHLDSGTLTPVLKKLEALGLVVKYRDKDDDRMVIVELTKEALALKEEITEVPEGVYCKLQNVDAKDLIELKKSVDKVLSKLD